MNKNRILVWIFLVIVTLTAVNPVIPAAPAENVIEIRTVREFSDFSKAAELDEYTAGKTISLLNDLDFSDQEFTPVPVYAVSLRATDTPSAAYRIQRMRPTSACSGQWRQTDVCRI